MAPQAQATRVKRQRGSNDYRIYGLTLRASWPLPQLLAAPADPPEGAVDVRFDVGGGLSDATPGTEAVDWIPLPSHDLPPSQRVWSGTGPDGVFVRLRYQGAYNGAYGALEFVIHPTARRVSAAWSESSPVKSMDDATALLVGAVLGCVLRLRGTICLHACAVAVGSRSVVILGERGMGKSTAAAALAQHGHAVLSDDLAAITEDASDGKDGPRWTTQPAYPRLRLVPTTIDAFDGPAAGPSPVMTGMDKRYLDLSTEGGARKWRFQPEPLPLGGIYLLQRRADVDAPVVEPIVGGARLTTLLAHTSADFAPLDQVTRAREFGRLGRLAATVPIRRIECPHDLERLPEVCEAIVDDASPRVRGQRS
jgi:hypothetical protein